MGRLGLDGGWVSSPKRAVCGFFGGSGDGFIWILDFWWILGGFWDGFCGMKEIKKSGGGDVRAKALSWDGEWDKA